MRCKLCKCDKPLRESHIIPSAFWESVSDKINRSVPISLHKNKLEFVQSGIKEKLLCQGCETKLSAWETTLKKDLVDIGNQTSAYLTIHHVGNNLLHVQNIRYERFKLGALSILWRMAISENDHYKSYDLGPYEEKIRIILYSGKCPVEKEYPLLLTQYHIDNKFQSGLIAGFPRGRFQNMFSVGQFIIWGHMFSFIVNDTSFPDIPVECVLRENGDLYVRIAKAEELASPNSVIARVFDKDVAEKMNLLRF